MEKLRFKNLSELKTMIGKELPKSEWIIVTQEMINDFANATLDKQWVHVDIERAKKESPFKSTIAHGFMSLALLSKMLEDLIVVDSLKLGLNYGLNYVRFPHPVPVNSKLQIQASIKDVEDQGEGVKVTFSCVVSFSSKSVAKRTRCTFANFFNCLPVDQVNIRVSFCLPTLFFGILRVLSLLYSRIDIPMFYIQCTMIFFD